MINRSPWLWNDSQSAAGMTAVTQRGIRIIKGKRAPGQSNPSPQFIQSQVAAALLWPIIRGQIGFIRSNVTNIPLGQTAVNVIYKKDYATGIDKSLPGLATLIPAGLAFSSGVMTPTPVLTVVATAAIDEVTFTWDPAVADASQSPDDMVAYVIRNARNGRMIGIESGIRADGTSTTLVPALDIQPTDVIGVYLNFKGAIGTGTEGTTSDTRFLSDVAA